MYCIFSCISFVSTSKHRDRYEREKRTANATVMSLQNTLDLSKKKILKEEEWKQTTDSVRKQLVEEKQQLLTRYQFYIYQILSTVPFCGKLMIVLEGIQMCALRSCSLFQSRVFAQ